MYFIHIATITRLDSGAGREERGYRKATQGNHDYAVVGGSVWDTGMPYLTPAVMRWSHHELSN